MSRMHFALKLLERRASVSPTAEAHRPGQHPEPSFDTNDPGASLEVNLAIASLLADELLGSELLIGQLAENGSEQTALISPPSGAIVELETQEEAPAIPALAIPVRQDPPAQTPSLTLLETPIASDGWQVNIEASLSTVTLLADALLFEELPFEEPPVDLPLEAATVSIAIDVDTAMPTPIAPVDQAQFADAACEELAKCEAAHPTSVLTEARVNGTADELNRDTRAMDQRRSIPLHAERPSTPIWRLPTTQPGRSYRDLAARIARDAGNLAGTSSLLITAVRGAALAGLNLSELAAALGQAGRDVLMVDAAHRLPPPTGDWSRTMTCGLNHILAGSATWREATCDTNLPGVSIVGAGPESSISREAECETNRESRIWQQLPAHYRYVLISAEAFNHPFTLSVVGLCRSTYLIVELGKEKKQALAAAMSGLQQAGARLRGAIVLGRLRPSA